MRWYELADNPLAITRVYSEVPSLQSVALREVILDRDGPRMILKLDLPLFPDKPPERWKFRGYSAVHLQLDLWGLESLQVAQWTAKNQVWVQIERTVKGRIALQVTSSQRCIQAVARSFRITLHKD